METIAVADVTESEMGVVREALTRLPDQSALGEMLACLLDTMHRGKDVVFGGIDTEVTPNEAAKLLHMSRPHLYKLLDDGLIPFKKVGTHKRLLLSDVLGFHVVQSSARKEFAETVAHAAQDREALVADLASIPENRRNSLLR